MMFSATDVQGGIQGQPETTFTEHNFRLTVLEIIYTRLFSKTSLYLLTLSAGLVILPLKGFQTTRETTVSGYPNLRWSADEFIGIQFRRISC